MTIIIKLNWIDVGFLVLCFALVLYGIGKALGWVTPKLESEPAGMVEVLMGLALIVQTVVLRLTNEAGEAVLSGWGFLILTCISVPTILLILRARPESAKEESRQMIRDFRRLYGGKSDASGDENTRES